MNKNEDTLCKGVLNVNFKTNYTIIIPSECSQLLVKVKHHAHHMKNTKNKHDPKLIVLQ